MIAYKAAVRVEQRTPALEHIENCILDTQAELGYPTPCVVTSINDSTHGENSRHYTNEALDFRTKNMGSLEKKRRFCRVLREKLGSRFTVLLEQAGQPNGHGHAQVRKGHHYP